MASWTRNFTGGQFPANWHTQLDYSSTENVDGNYSSISLRLYVYCDSGNYSQTGLWIPRGRGSWMGEYGGNVTRNINAGSGKVLMAAWDGNVGHDANGNLYVSVGTYVNAPSNNQDWVDIGWTLPRIAKAPDFADVNATKIKPTSAVLGIEIQNFGRGTIAAMYTQYRLPGQNDSQWISQPSQEDVGGYNYFPITGLKAGKSYEYRGVVYNNNGDQNISSVRTFRTQSVPGMLPVLTGLIS